MFPVRWPFPSPRRLLTSLNLLRLLWLLLFFTIEHFLPRHAIRNCSWPLVDRPRECQVAIIADPQIVDENTYPRRGIAMWLTKVFTDRYMRRNWEYLMRQEPGTVIFLGDLMDGGREWEDDKWFSEYRRFWKVFPYSEGTRVIPTVPGNHDIGLGDGIRVDRLDRFKKHFTDTNATSQRLEICGFDMILLDTPSLINSVSAEIYDPPIQFLDKPRELKWGQGRLLFTHIPLYRPPAMDCGPNRESSLPIRVGAGHQYQNTLTPQITSRIIDTLWPVQAVFSGDDHDYCAIQHELEGTRDFVPEYTVKSFSWAMGIKYPGYQLLSLGPAPAPRRPTRLTLAAPSETQHASFETKLCVLPSPVNGYIIYALMAIISGGWICAIHCSGWRRLDQAGLYFELDNLGKDEEIGQGYRLLAKVRRWHIDIRGLIRDFASISLFVLGCIIMQIVGLY